jgi:DNA (cytosine-5)-methyltransferase 1
MGKYTLIDLFAGCGGLTRGFEDTERFRSIFAVECDRD